MAFQIPDNALNPLAEFIALPEPQAIQVINAVREAQPALGMWRFAESVAAKSGLDVQKVETILSTFAGLHLVRTASDRPLDEFVSDLSNALRKLGDPRFVPSDWGNFEEALKAILGSEDSLGVSAKGLDLLLDNERGLHSVRIVTDVRHVF